MQPTRPTLGHIVLFTLDRQTAEQINQGGSSKQYQAGEQVAAMVVGIQTTGNRCNLTLFPDGPTTMHIANVDGAGDGRGNRTWTWPVITEQAA